MKGILAGHIGAHTDQAAAALANEEYVHLQIWGEIASALISSNEIALVQALVKRRNCLNLHGRKQAESAMQATLSIANLWLRSLGLFPAIAFLRAVRPRVVSEAVNSRV